VILSLNHNTGILDAQDVSLPLTVIYDSVSIQPNNSANSILIREGSELPIRSGDMITTTQYSRATITVEHITIWLAPNSQLNLNHYAEINSTEYHLDISLTGHAVFVVDGDMITDAQIQLNRLQIDEFDGAFAVWSDSDDVVIVQTGAVNITTPSDSFTLTENQALRVNDNQADPVNIVAGITTNSARLIGALDGCDAIVNTENNTELITRSAAGRGFERVYNIENRTPVKVLEQNIDRTWVRIQYSNGFAWALALAIELNDDCDTLIISAADRSNPVSRQIFELQATEAELLRFYYGNPNEDIWLFPPAIFAPDNSN